MWNREKAIRLIGVVTKEYGKEIIAEGSRSVMGLEDHIDKMIAEILEVNSDMVTVAREWRKVIEREAITEGIDKVKTILGQEVKHIVEKDNELKLQENKTDIELVYQSETDSLINNILDQEIELENDQSLIDRNTKEESSQMEEVQESIRRESDTASLNYQQVTTEELEDDILPADSDSSLERSIWTPNKDRCEEKKTLKAKVAAIKVLRNNLKHRE